MSVTIPPNTRAPGTVNPPGDMNDVSDVLTNAGMKFFVENTAWSGGADPTGTADSTAAINAALAACPYGGTVTGQPGATYKVSGPLTIPPQVKFDLGKGSHIDAVNGTTIIPAAEFSGAAVILFVDETTGGYSVASNGQEACGFTIDCSNLTPGASIDGIQAQGFVHGVYVHDIQIRYAANHGFYGTSNGSGAPYSWRVRKVNSYTADGYGFSAAPFTDSTFSDCEAIGGSKAGWYLPGSPSNTHFINCRGEYNIYNGFQLTGAWSTATGAGGCTFTGCSTDGNNQDGFLVQATGTAPITLNGCMFRRDGNNGGPGGGGYGGLTFDGSTIPVTVDGITVYPGIAFAEGSNSPEYGIKFASESANIAINSGVVHAQTQAVYDDGSGNTSIYVAPTLISRTGSTASPVANTTTPKAKTGRAPVGAITQTIDPVLINTSGIAQVSGTLYLYAVTLEAGRVVTDLNFLIGTTNGLTLTHGWAALLNSSYLQLAHSADITSGNLAGASEIQTYTLTAPYVPQATALYWLAICTVASTQPTLAGYGTPQGTSGGTALPVAGPATTGLSGPGTDGSTSYEAITANSDPAYAYVS